ARYPPVGTAEEMAMFGGKVIDYRGLIARLPGGVVGGDVMVRGEPQKAQEGGWRQAYGERRFGVLLVILAAPLAGPPVLLGFGLSAAWFDGLTGCSWSPPSCRSVSSGTSGCSPCCWAPPGRRGKRRRAGRRPGSPGGGPRRASGRGPGRWPGRRPR